ncbi:hypothetical protein [uncultured Roseobacter sp.]|nr:hypothetical protein [uncultured Roseobacter sp.]
MQNGSDVLITDRNVLVNGDGQPVITLEDVNIADLDASDFIF